MYIGCVSWVLYVHQKQYIMHAFGMKSVIESNDLVKIEFLNSEIRNEHVYTLDSGLSV